MGPLMERRYRTQVQTGQIMVGLALHLTAPVAKPTLWVLEIWGGFQLPGWVWPAIFLAVGLGLLLARRPRVAQFGMMTASLLYVTIGAASYLTLGWNAFTLVCLFAAVHCVWTAIDLRARADYLREVERGRA
ncbi:hypothetical protein QOL99_00090 [Deinococcus sp. MIMF12]|uniref:Uncharacterized protein n=1 Tax=Deinococcus rhizophilus TaxID=3049544 RepID=A0ABT7JBX8_9DEIO|nr:hypothetical protein [Deinococcus rhizophilus]MDL2342547.1 hypothetical protein [Deinococcus rhizophilus]